MYWVGPSLGATLAAALYEYLFCPDPQKKKKKKRYSDVFIRTAFATAKQRQDSVTAQEPLFTAMGLDRAEGKERGQEKEVSEEVLSSVWLKVSSEAADLAWRQTSSGSLALEVC